MRDAPKNTNLERCQQSSADRNLMSTIRFFRQPPQRSRTTLTTTIDDAVADNPDLLYTGRFQASEPLSMHCWARYLLWLIIAVLGIGNMLTACGNKDNLYLPEPEQEKTQEKTQ